MNFAAVLCIVCFKNVSAIFFEGSSTISLSGQSATELSELEQTQCNGFRGLKVYAHVQIGDIIFSSDVKEYSSNDLEFELKTSDATTNIGDFSIAQYQIRAVESSLQQSNVVDQFLINWFDWSSCFESVNLLTDFKTKAIELKLGIGRACTYQTNDDPRLELVLYHEGKREIIISEVLPRAFNTWPLTFSCGGAVDCAHMYDLLTSTLVPKAFIEISGAQQISKNAIEIGSNGDPDIKPTTVNTLIELRQPITNCLDISTTNAFGSPRMRFLMVTVGFYYNVYDETFAWNEDHDLFVVKVCVNQNKDFSGNIFCFTQHYEKAFVKTYFAMYCTAEAVVSEARCLEMLATIYGFEHNFSVIISQAIYKGDHLVDQYTMIANLDIHCYDPMTMTLSKDKVCIAMNRRYYCYTAAKDTDFEILTEKVSLINRFMFPNDIQRYCFSATAKDLELLYQMDYADIEVIIGLDYYPVIHFETTIARATFDISFAIAGVCGCLFAGLLFAIKLKLPKTVNIMPAAAN